MRARIHSPDSGSRNRAPRTMPAARPRPPASIADQHRRSAHQFDQHDQVDGIARDAAFFHERALRAEVDELLHHVGEERECDQRPAASITPLTKTVLSTMAGTVAAARSRTCETASSDSGPARTGTAVSGRPPPHSRATGSPLSSQKIDARRCRTRPMRPPPVASAGLAAPAFRSRAAARCRRPAAGDDAPLGDCR